MNEYTRKRKRGEKLNWDGNEMDMHPGFPRNEYGEPNVMWSGFSESEFVPHNWEIQHAMGVTPHEPDIPYSGPPIVPVKRECEDPTEPFSVSGTSGEDDESSYEETGQNSITEFDDVFEPVDSHVIYPPSAPRYSPQNHYDTQNSPNYPMVYNPAPLSIQPISLTMINNFIEHITNFVSSMDTNLAKVDEDIKNTSLPINREAATTILQYLMKFQESIDEQLNKCFNIEYSCLLHCKHLHIVKCRRKDLQRQLLHIDLFRKEIEHCCSYNDYGDAVFATLFIAFQPFPTTIKQHLTVDPIEVRILTAARTRVDLLSPIKAELLSDWNVGNNKKQAAPIKGHEERCNKDGLAIFKNMKFTVGTGCKAVQVKFRATYQTKTQKRTLESAPSESFIVMTNTKQWAEAQGVLLKKEMFKGRLQLPAQQFANYIQTLYIQASRQDPLKAPRPLGPSDFEFLFTTKILKSFNVSEQVAQTDFDRFWGWFGPVLQKIRYQKFLLPMWTAGLFWGFISKAESERVLEPYGAGTFLLRFSEKMSNGSMAVAYKQSQNCVRHYLIKSKDTSGQGHSLPQFIRETSSLLQFLRLTITEGFETKLSLIEKHQALAKIGSKRRKTMDNKGSGYDEDFLDLVAAVKNWE